MYPYKRPSSPSQLPAVHAALCQQRPIWSSVSSLRVGSSLAKLHHRERTQKEFELCPFSMAAPTLKSEVSCRLHWISHINMDYVDVRPIAPIALQDCLTLRPTTHASSFCPTPPLTRYYYYYWRAQNTKHQCYHFVTVYTMTRSEHVYTYVYHTLYWLTLRSTNWLNHIESGHGLKRALLTQARFVVRAQTRAHNDNFGVQLQPS